MAAPEYLRDATGRTVADYLDAALDGADSVRISAICADFKRYSGTRMVAMLLSPVLFHPDPAGALRLVRAGEDGPPVWETLDPVTAEDAMRIASLEVVGRNDGNSEAAPYREDARLSAPFDLVSYRQRDGAAVHRQSGRVLYLLSTCQLFVVFDSWMSPLVWSGVKRYTPILEHLVRDFFSVSVASSRAMVRVGCKNLESQDAMAVFPDVSANEAIVDKLHAQAVRFLEALQRRTWDLEITTRALHDQRVQRL